MYKRITYSFEFGTGLIYTVRKVVTASMMHAEGFYLCTEKDPVPGIRILRVPIDNMMEDPYHEDGYSTILGIIRFAHLTLLQDYAQIIGWEDPCLVAGGRLLEPFFEDSLRVKDASYISREVLDRQRRVAKDIPGGSPEWWICHGSRQVVQLNEGE